MSDGEKEEKEEKQGDRVARGQEGERRERGVGNEEKCREIKEIMRRGMERGAKSEKETSGEERSAIGLRDADGWSFARKCEMVNSR